MVKSAAQIRRMQKRAKERGESYVAPEKKPNENSCNTDKIGGVSEEDERKANAAKKLQDELKRLELNEGGLNSKEKRTAKRKAEAIALEEANGVDDEEEKNKITNIEDLLKWYEGNQKRISSCLKKQKRQIESENSKQNEARMDAFNKYQTTISEIETNEDLNAKDRRSAKRKAEAIACEESNFTSINELTEWHEANPELAHRSKKRKKSNGDYNGTSSKNPYILFIGQIPYTTTADDIYKHFQKYIGKKEITKETMSIRIPLDKEKNEKIKKASEENKQQEIAPEIDDYGAEELFDYEQSQSSEDANNKTMCRGFAFAEFKDPELMYECLKLHHTALNGRRINVSRGAGGGKEARKEKHKLRRKEQDEYISSTVDKIIKDYVDRGELQEGELDEGAVLLCKRRSAAIVEAALSEYIEQRRDRDLENPSSFFTRIICDVTEEGEAGTHSSIKKKMNDSFGKSRSTSSKNDLGKSKFQKEGVDMSLSHNIESGTRDMSKIFPSMSRGRGRGRGGIVA